MVAVNNANINVNLNVDKAIGNAQKLKANMQQVGTTMSATGAKVSAASTAVNSRLATMGIAMTGVGIKSTAMSGQMNASFAAVGSGAKIMGSKVQSGTGMATMGMNTASTAAIKTNRSFGIAALGAAGMAASITALATSFSNLTAYEIKHDNAQLKVKKSQDSLAAAKVNAANYQAKLNKMVREGTTSGDLYNYYLGMSNVYTSKLTTEKEKLIIAERKAKLAVELLSDANANFTTGLLTSGLNIGVMSSLLFTNIGLTKANTIGRLRGTKATAADTVAQKLNNKTTMINNKVNKVAIATNRIKTTGMFTSNGMMAGGTIATGANATATLGRTGAIVGETAAVGGSNIAHTVRNALMGPIGIAILVAAVAAVGVYAYAMHKETEKIKENNEATVYGNEVLTDTAEVVNEVEVEMAELTATTNGLTDSTDGLNTSLKNTQSASQIWYEEMRKINTESRAAAAGVATVNEELDEFSKKNQILGDISGLTQGQVGQILVDFNKSKTTGARGAEKYNTSSVLREYGFETINKLGLDFISQNNQIIAQDLLDTAGPIFDGKTFSGYGKYITQMGLTETRDIPSEIERLLYDKHIISNAIEYWIKTTGTNDPDSFKKIIKKYMRDNKIKSENLSIEMFSKFGFKDFKEIDTLWSSVNSSVSGGQNMIPADKYKIITDLYELGHYDMNLAVRHLQNAGAGKQDISRWLGHVRKDKRIASGYYDSNMKNEVQGTFGYSLIAATIIEDEIKRDLQRGGSGKDPSKRNIYIVNGKLYTREEWLLLPQREKQNTLGGTGPAYGAVGMVGEGSTGDGELYQDAFNPNSMNYGGLVAGKRMVGRNNRGIQHGGVDWAGKAAWIAELQKKDDIANALRAAGLGFGALDLTDGSQIRTIRGHLTGKRTIDERPQGFKNGKTVLDESYWGAGAGAWQTLKSSVSMISNSEGGRMVEQFRRARMLYQENLEVIIKRMMDQRDKDKEQKDAELKRLQENDGSIAKEFFNKVGENDSYEIYDRINHKNLQTQINDGLTANV